MVCVCVCLCVCVCVCVVQKIFQLGRFTENKSIHFENFCLPRNRLATNYKIPKLLGQKVLLKKSHMKIGLFTPYLPFCKSALRLKTKKKEKSPQKELSFAILPSGILDSLLVVAVP